MKDERCTMNDGHSQILSMSETWEIIVGCPVPEAAAFQLHSTYCSSILQCEVTW